MKSSNFALVDYLKQNLYALKSNSHPRGMAVMESYARNSAGLVPKHDFEESHFGKNRKRFEYHTP